MANTYSAIATVTVGSGGAATMTFSSIPQTYTDLKLVISARADTTAFVGNIKFNNSSANFSRRTLVDRDGNAESYNASDNSAFVINQSAYTASTFGNSEIYIANYTGSNNKSFSSDGVNENNATGIFLQLLAGLWSNSAAITQIDLSPSSGNFVQYSTATLYGIKNS